jgi:hypothetical protein
VSVWDMTSCSLSSLSRAQLQMVQRIMHVVGAHYPERNDKLFIVNAPWYLRFDLIQCILLKFLIFTLLNLVRVLYKYCILYCRYTGS